MPDETTIPWARGGFPVIGHLLPLLKDPLSFLDSLPDQGDLVRVGVGPVSAVVVCDPELNHQVLVNDRLFDKGGMLFDRLREVVGYGLGTVPHAPHRLQRRMLQPAFVKSRLPGHAAIMVKEISKVVDSWQDGQIVTDVPGVLHDLASRITTATMFTAPLPEPLIEELTDALHVVMDSLIFRMATPHALAKIPTRGKRRYDSGGSRLRAATGRLIDIYHQSDLEHDDILSMLLSARDDDGRPLSQEQISSQVLTMYIGGVETVAVTVSWALHFIACMPEILERLHHEVDAALAGRNATWNDLPQLPYTRAIISETLRIRPPGWILTRITTADTELGGHFLPAGTTVIYSPYLMHRRVDIYPTPTAFDPDRWDTRHTPAPPRGAYVPFALGARRCIGDTFGTTEAMLIVSSIAARWHLHPHGAPVSPKPRTSLVPDQLDLRITARAPAPHPCGTGSGITRPGVTPDADRCPFTRENNA